MKSLKLTNQVEIPILGFGTWQLSGDICITSVSTALEVGYRLLDTADSYGNHQEVAKAIRSSGIKRGELFITTKIPRTKLQPPDIRDCVERYLEELETNYIDLLLIHWPNKEIPIQATLEAMNKFKKQGQVKALGVSNFTINHLEDVLNTGIEITNNQVELHPTFNQKKLVAFCHAHKITVTAYSPIARGADLKLEAVTMLAKKYGSTPSQIILAWIMSRGIITIPKSSNSEHIKDNFEATGIKLSAEDLSLIDSIPQDRRLINPATSEFDYWARLTLSMINWKVLIILGLIITSLGVYLKKTPSPLPPSLPQGGQGPNTSVQAVEVITTNLAVPWALAFMPNGNLLVTERAGSVKIVNLTTDKSVKEVGKVSVHQVSESGLHGVAVDPNFTQNHFIYLYYTYSSENQNTLNRVSRFTFDSDQIRDEVVLVDQIPGAPTHDGGRIKFGPDKNLYLTTGDAQNPSFSQDKNSLAGKILRVTLEGGVSVYSYGHRNPQGITWDDSGRLWSTEHGQSATDELNLIELGKNYGWPNVRGDQKGSEYQSPVIHSGSDTWAPAGVAYYKDSLYFAGLRGNALYRYNLLTKSLQTLFQREFGRLREVILGPDNYLYLTTSNRDGRGIPKEGDDKIIRVDPNFIGVDPTKL